MFQNTIEDSQSFNEIKYLMSRYPLSLRCGSKECCWMNGRWYVFVKDHPEKDFSDENFHYAMQHLVEPD